MMWLHFERIRRYLHKHQCWINVVADVAAATGPVLREAFSFYTKQWLLRTTKIHYFNRSITA